MTADPTDTVAALSEGAVSFTDDQTVPVDGLGSIVETLSSVRVLGIGEATHGTREFHRARHRLLEHLVTRCGLRVVACEAPFSEALPVGAYVFDGTGDARTALGEIHYWTHNVEATLSTVEWLRSFNAGRPPEDRVRLYGIDIGSERATDAAGTHLRATLAETLPSVRDEFGDELDRLADGELVTADGTPFERRLAAVRETTTALAGKLEERRATFEAAASPRRWRIARRQIRTIRQVGAVLEARREGGQTGLRDRYIAENVRWLCGHEDADTVAVWAHAGHVLDTERPGVGATMGRSLRARYGDDYYALAFEVGTGRVTALSPSGDDLDTFPLDPPPDGALAETLRAVPHEQFLIDFRGLPPEVGLDEVRYLRQIGSRFDPDRDWRQYHTAVVPRRAADGVLYVDDGSPVRPLTDR